MNISSQIQTIIISLGCAAVAAFSRYAYNNPTMYRIKIGIPILFSVSMGYLIIRYVEDDKSISTAILFGVSFLVIFIAGSLSDIFPKDPE